uniref:Neurotransmitter-gated ion-channel ligand-binding domain-containing protein n=1 Tax=Hippocampus comes TaxID=109280 RepID=A0A3Q3DWY6_HIPCM
NQLALLEALKPMFKMGAIRPVTNMTTPTNVSLYFLLYGILGVVCSAQYKSLYYDSVPFMLFTCGTDKITLPRHKFWVPDLVIREFMDQDKAPFVPYVNLHSNGKMHDAKPARVVSSCNLDIYTFPFDRQDCTLTFGSFINLGNRFCMMTFDQSCGSLKIRTSFRCDLLLRLRLTIQVETTSNVLTTRCFRFFLNLLLPSIFLITVDLFSFLLPPQSVDRSSFKMTLILGYTVFLLIMNDLLPITGNTIPIINIFFSMCLALMVASLLETILITNLLLSSKNVIPVPHWIRVFVLHFLGRVVGLVSTLRGCDDNPHEEKEPAMEDRALQELRSLGGDLKVLRLQVEQQLGSTQSSKEWIQVGFIIDRVLFGIYLLFISVSFITIKIIWLYTISHPKSAGIAHP